jgi:polyhydroxyalkanoate synthesis regulator phasin
MCNHNNQLSNRELDDKLLVTDECYVTMSKPCSVASGILETESGFTVDLESEHWLKWLKLARSFRYYPNSTDAPFTARKEGEHWYGYRKQQGKLHKRYIGKAEKLTVTRLDEIASLLNTPTQPRVEQVTHSVTEVTEYATKTEMEQLHSEIAALREEVSAALGKLQAR